MSDKPPVPARVLHMTSDGATIIHVDLGFPTGGSAMAIWCVRRAGKLVIVRCEEVEENQNDLPTEHDNRPLLPYLQQIADAGDWGLPKKHADGIWPDAKKTRQTMYIAGLAKDNKEGFLFLTVKGREFLATHQPKP